VDRASGERHILSTQKAENEKARLEALRRFEILDTAPEQGYDDIVKVAAHVMDTPIALVSLIDENRQWFKARLGLDVSETPREIAFCTHAIQQSETMIVEDARNDARFAQNPLVTGAPDIRFYMGAPLITSEGHALGTLCVIDGKPRHITAEQQDALEALRRIAVNLIEQRAMSRKLAEALNNIQELRGLLPICAYCKNVRNDQGYWNEISHYFAEHTDVKLTHGICPACSEKHFPEYWDRKKQNPTPNPQ